MLKSDQIEKMSMVERLQAMEQLWDAVREQSEAVPSPEWHEDVLAERKARAERGDARFITLEQLRERLRLPAA